MIVYSKDNCPACETLKKKLIKDNIKFTEKKIGKDITREDFLKKFPNVRSVPFIEELDNG